MTGKTSFCPRPWRSVASHNTGLDEAEVYLGGKGDPCLINGQLPFNTRIGCIGGGFQMAWGLISQNPLHLPHLSRPLIHKYTYMSALSF